ncbi:MAG: hypothetical protein ACP5KW_09365 [Thermoproteota archaeon]
METVLGDDYIEVYDKDKRVFRGEVKDGKLIAPNFSVDIPRKWELEVAWYFVEALEKNLPKDVAIELETYFAVYFDEIKKRYLKNILKRGASRR